MSDSEKAPPPVPEAVTKLLALGYIAGLKFDYRATGTDTAETWAVFTGWEGKKIEGWYSSFSPFLDYRPTHNAVVQVERRWREAAEARAKYDKSNAAEVALFRRLKAKYEPEK